MWIVHTPQGYGTFQDDAHLYYAMEYISRGTLKQQLMRSPKGRLSERRARFYATEVVLALKHLHAQGVVCKNVAVHTQKRVPLVLHISADPLCSVFQQHRAQQVDAHARIQNAFADIYYFPTLEQ